MKTTEDGKERNKFKKLKEKIDELNSQILNLHRDLRNANSKNKELQIEINQLKKSMIDEKEQMTQSHLKIISDINQNIECEKKISKRIIFISLKKTSKKYHF